MENGHSQIARLLEEAGAPAPEPNEEEQFLALCMAGDERGARAMLADAPDLLARAPQNMVQKAVGTKRIGAVKLALDLGFDPNCMEDNGPIHQAGTLAENPEILRILLASGASLTLRDPWYDGTAIGWADFFNHSDLRDKLLNKEGSVCLMRLITTGWIVFPKSWRAIPRRWSAPSPNVCPGSPNPRTGRHLWYE